MFDSYFNRKLKINVPINGVKPVTLTDRTGKQVKNSKIIFCNEGFCFADFL